MTNILVVGAKQSGGGGYTGPQVVAWWDAPIPLTPTTLTLPVGVVLAGRSIVPFSCTLSEFVGNVCAWLTPGSGTVTFQIDATSDHGSTWRSTATLILPEGGTSDYSVALSGMLNAGDGLRMYLATGSATSVQAFHMELLGVPS
jgi:hypothetical protein